MRKQACTWSNISKPCVADSQVRDAGTDLKLTSLMVQGSLFTTGITALVRYAIAGKPVKSNATVYERAFTLSNDTSNRILLPVALTKRYVAAL